MSDPTLDKLTAWRIAHRGHKPSQDYDRNVLAVLAGDYGNFLRALPGMLARVAKASAELEAANLALKDGSARGAQHRQELEEALAKR